MRSFSLTECARVIEKVTGRKFPDSTIRTWKERGRMPYLERKFHNDQPDGIVTEHLQQLALQVELVYMNLSPAFAGGIACTFTPPGGDALEEKMHGKSNLLGIGFFSGEYPLGVAWAPADTIAAKFPENYRRFRVDDVYGDVEEEPAGVVHGKEKPRTVIVIDAVDLFQRVEQAVKDLFGEEVDK
jgi:hypothetical protein